MQNAHHVALEQKHAMLDRRIAQEAQRPNPNSGLLSELKRRKLKVKEELAGI